MKTNGKINILFVLPNFDTGGSEKLVLDIIRNLDTERFSPVLAVFFTGTYEGEYRKLGHPFYVVHENGLRSKLSTFFFLKGIAERHGIDVVNTHHTSPLIQGLLPFKLFGGAALVHTEHSKLCFDAKIHARALMLEKVFLKWADAAVGISQGVSDYFRDELNVPAAKVRMILNGVDLKRFDLPGFDARACRAKIGVRGDAFTIGLFANFRTEKNHAALISAVSVLKRNGRSVRLLLCGSGPTQAACIAQAKELGIEESVHFLGVRMDIPELMNTLDAYCLPSHFEGLPFSALEAMAAGVPVVGTDVAGINEIIKDGDNGLMAKAGSPEAIAERLSDLMDDPGMAKKIALRGREFVNRFSFEKMIGEYEALFSEMAERKRLSARRTA